MALFQHTVVHYGIPHIYEVEAASPAAALGRVGDAVNPIHGVVTEPTNHVSSLIAQVVSTVPKGH